METPRVVARQRVLLDNSGLIGLLLAVLALYAGTAFEMEAQGRPVLPVLRRGPGRDAMTEGLADQVGPEPGVRSQL